MSKQNKHYNNCHAYINRHYGKANKCENSECDFENPKRFEWALLKDKEYSKNIEDYIQLCPSCHRKYDFTDEDFKLNTEYFNELVDKIFNENDLNNE